MAKFGSFKNAVIIINGYDLSDHCSEFTLSTSTEELENHAFGDYTRYNTPGLLEWSVDATFFQDFASGSVHECLENLRNQLATTDVPPTFPILMRAKTGPTAPDNPAWSGSGFISDYQPIGGEHGENYMVEVTISAASDLSVLTS